MDMMHGTGMGMWIIGILSATVLLLLIIWLAKKIRELLGKTW